MVITDIEIFGGGIFGLSIAYSCAKRGYRVRVIEKRHIGAGASGGFLGALAPHTPENWNAKKQFQFDSLVMAQEWWTEAASIGGIQPSYKRCGRFQPIANSQLLSLAKKRQAFAQRYWQGRAEWQIVPTAGDWMPNSATGFIIYDTLSASINPKSALACLASAIRILGGEIIEGCTDCKGADIQVYATGYEGLIELNKALGKEIGRGEKGQAALLDFAAGGQQHIYADNIHIIPHENGTVAIGSTSERYHNRQSNTDPQIDQLVERARELVPCIQDAPIISRWAGIRPRSSTRTPILGSYPERVGHYIANGGFKIGFGIAPIVGESMADLMLNDDNRIPGPFSPNYRKT